jgi:hypothetical protein
MELPEPMVPNQPFALSIGLSYDMPRAQFWGTDAVCGDTVELLWDGPLSAGVPCVSFSATAAHTNILMVWYSQNTHDDVTLCSSGSCAP